MSRLGKTPIALPQGIDLQVSADGIVQVKGPKGTQNCTLEKGISVQKDGTTVVVVRDEKLVPSKAMHGLYRSLIKNLIVGVAQGFEKKLTLIGVGFRAAVKGQKLELQVGYSFPRELDIPKGISVAIDKGTEILITGMDKRVVGQFAADVRAARPPEPYKGKGIRYKDEFVRKKAGKAAKAAAK